MKATGISTCYRNVLPFTNSSLSFKFRSDSAFSLIHHSNFVNKRNFSKFSRSIVSATMEASFKAEEARVPAALPLPTPPVTKFKIALCQLSVTTDKERNIAHAKQAIEDAAGKGAQLILLPEIWNSPYSNDSFPVYAEDIDAGGDASPSTRMLSEVSRSLKITIIGGSIPERTGDKLYNTCCVFGTDGKLMAKHRKIHLFDIDIPGKMTFKESKTLTAGVRPTIVDTEVGRIGIGICYDIRFQELAAIYAARGAHLLCYPGAFNTTTGPLHWELLQRARAADCQVWSYFFCTYLNQLYVATCSPARDSGSSYVAWGHSTLVGPFGEVLVTTEHEETTLIAEIDYSVIEQRRTYLPFQKQRRGDLYQLVDVDRLNSTGAN
ncbi:omega-amidase, chloroplastic isoform X1 [Nicotiana tabacum]|uniref:Omega-amidase, chloroplastic isoform X1 n=1 Tax=Nicotiana tabacum TaxID=4097 RepID=A0A1S4ANX8_TOBAC|nr:PREDICTED: omega-amidase, chloroplastic-like isoform X1 [Nicotiana tabacum]